jgi:hypothetical protein
VNFTFVQIRWIPLRLGSRFSDRPARLGKTDACLRHQAELE